MQLGAPDLFFIGNKLHCTVVGFMISYFCVRSNAGTFFLSLHMYLI